MPCEKCWNDAYIRSRLDFDKTQAEHYRDILQERLGNPCTPDEQDGNYLNHQPTPVHSKETK